MNPVDLEAVAPEEALRMACEAFGKEFHVSASPDLVEFLRVWRVDNLLSQFITFSYKNVPYRRGKDRMTIFPANDSYQNGFSQEWLDAPEEYIECYSAGRVILIPVKRPQIL